MHLPPFECNKLAVMQLQKQTTRCRCNQRHDLTFEPLRIRRRWVPININRCIMDLSCQSVGLHSKKTLCTSRREFEKKKHFQVNGDYKLDTVDVGRVWWLRCSTGMTFRPATDVYSNNCVIPRNGLHEIWTWTEKREALLHLLCHICSWTSTQMYGDLISIFFITHRSVSDVRTSRLFDWR
jgi:hypothetical protein